MKKLSFLKKSIALFILPSLLLPCYAASNYIGIDYVLTDIKIADESAQPTATAFTIGTSGKGRFENMYRIDFDLEQSTALYLLLKSASRDGYSIDVAVGYAYNDLTLTGPENTYNGNEQYNGFSWKAAINYQIPYVKNSQIKLGYQSLYNKDGLDISGISLGISYHF